MKHGCERMSIAMSRFLTKTGAGIIGDDMEINHPFFPPFDLEVPLHPGRQLFMPQVQVSIVNPSAVPHGWIEKGLDTAEFFAERFSKDPSTKVGAAIMNHRKRFVGLGYNGLPDRLPDEPSILSNREAKNDDTIHAEVNAVLNATASTEDCYLFVSHPPCGDCAKFIIQAGIVEVHFRDLDPNSSFSQRWAASIAKADDKFKRAGLPAFGWSKEGALTRRLGAAA